jgi:cytochrome c oxidase cbb3-type subunit 4
MYKEILQGIDHVAIWPVVSFSIFFLFFILLLWYVFTADKKFIQKMKELPLNESDPQEHSIISPVNKSQGL